MSMPVTRLPVRRAICRAGPPNPEPMSRHTVALDEREAADEQVDRVGAAGVELIEVVQRAVGRGVQVWIFAEQPVDRLADSRFSVGHRTRSFPSPGGICQFG